VIRSLGPALLVLLAQQVLFPAPAAIVVRGLIVGGLTALVALGMALIYRANRIVNFAQADLGYAPTVVAFLLLAESGVPYPVAVAVGLASAVAVGAITERVVIRRFAQSPRLLVTILTVGLSQVLAAGALLVPRLWDTRLIAGRVEPPFDATQRIGVLTFDANDLLALVATPVLVAVVATFLRSSDAGVAIRASADSADRASLLGVPVARLQTVVWSLAAALAFVAVFLRSGILELPTGTALGFSVLFRALAALLLGRMTDLPGVTAAALALGALELGVEWNHGFELIDPVLGVVVVIALIARRREAASLSRADVAAWHAGEAVRPMPDLLARLPVVRIARFGALALVGAVALAVPVVLPADDVFRASAMLIYALLGVSLVVLSGWAGTVSLGQVAFFAIGAAVAGALIVEQGVDLFPAMVVAAVVGAGVAALVGIPTLRLRGLYLAITTFALALATTSYLLNGSYFDWVPSGDRVERVPFLGGLQVETETEVYYLALVVLVAVIVGMRGVRTSRFGRALLALRDNERAAQAYAVDAARTQLAAFALAGGIAALAGALFVHHEQAFDGSSYSPIENLAVFTMVVVGGMGTTAGAVLGSLFLLGGRWFLDTDWQFLASGIGVVVILLVAPSGLAGLMYRVRDAWLRTVARRQGIDVPAYSSSPADAANAAGLPAAPERPSAPAGPSAPDDRPVGRPATAGAPATEAPPAPGPDAPADHVGADGDATAGASSGPGVTVGAAGDASTAGVGTTATGAGDLLLDVRDIEVGYGGVPVLFGVDLAVPRGGAVALLGTNGAGKSTLLKAISGLAPPDAGRVVVDGVDLTGRPAHVVAAHGVAQMPGGHGVFPSLSVADNLRVAGWLRRRDRAAFDADVERMRTLFPVLAERADDQAGHLSGGQQQMLALAMSVLTRPRLLMIDELSLGLAPAVVGQLLRFVDQLRADGTTLVVVEQSVNVAVAIADTAVFMERGQVRFAGPSQGLLERPDLLRSVFLGAASTPAAAGPSSAPEPVTGPSPAPPADAPSAAPPPAGPSAESPAEVAAPDAAPSAGTPAGAAPVGHSSSPSPVGASVAGAGAARAAHDEGGTPSAAGTAPRPGAVPAGAASGGAGVPALRVAGVSVAFGGVQAVADVSFDVVPGEVVGVIGPNGAGKTTLFDLLSGFVPLDAGRIDLAGRDVTHLSAPQRARRGLGRSFQDARLFATMTVDEAIAVALERWVTVGDPLSAAFHLPSIVDSEHRVRRRVDQLVDLLGLTRYRSLFVGELSTGTRRVVDLACLLAHQPRVVLLDEPASGIAQREVEQLAPLIRRIRDETGASLVVVEHDIPLVEQVADRIVAMDQGRVVAIGPPAAVLSDPVVLRSYLGDDHAAIHRSGAAAPARPAETRG
jgi:ABC-type branched-subunit amino acid transport system ATPase component/ABC-type branched-subunit amino acid transport system permease subunit